MTDDHEHPAYLHFDIVGLEQAETVARLVHRIADAAGIALPEGLPALPAGLDDLKTWKKALPRYKAGHNGFLWEMNFCSVSYVMALAEPASRRDLCVVSHMILTAFHDHEWHFKLSPLLADYVGREVYETLVAELAAHANADVMTDMAAAYVSLGYLT
jgi:hypothetical protein